MASFPLVSNEGFLITHNKGKLAIVKSKSVGRCRTVSLLFPKSFHALVSLPFVGSSHGYCKPQYGMQNFRVVVSSLVNEDRNIETQVVKAKKYGLRRGFRLRLRPRFRLLVRKLKRVEVKAVLDGLGTFLRKNLRRVTLSTSISVVLGLCFLFLKMTAVPIPKAVPYSDFIESLKCGTVSTVQFEEGSRRIYYNMNPGIGEITDTAAEESLAPAEHVVDSDGKSAISANNHESEKEISEVVKPRHSTPAPAWQFSTRKVQHDEKYLLNLMREKGTIYGSAPQSALMSLRGMLITVLSLWIPLTPLMWLLYRQLSAANSPAKKRRPSNQSVNFDDVEGVDAAKIELMEVVLCLRGSINYNRLGAKLPKGVLLVGPPGTGKTLLARAVAGEAGVPFFSVSASEFVELFVGRGAARIRDLFSVARKNAPAIIFIDELDAVGGKRGRSFNDERDQTLNQLLTEMDGFDSTANIVVIAATNRPEALDPALCRPGRFSRNVYVGEPDEVGRRKILAVHLRGIPLEEDTNVICDLVASLTQGFVGADLANIANEAALLAARRGGDVVAREDMMEAIERAKYGIKDRKSGPGALSQELVKLFPWMPSLIGKSDVRRGRMEGMGYQTLS